MSRLAATRWTTVASVGMGVLLALCLSRGVEDVRQYRSAQALKLGKLEQLARLETRRDETRDLAERLKSDPITRERLARAEGYSQPGETVYIIEHAQPKEPPQATTAATTPTQ